MIVYELTEEFIENHYFVLDKPYCIEKYDGYGFSTGEYMWLEEGSEWQVTDDSYIGGEIHLDGLTDNTWIEITEETFRECFSAHEWLPRDRGSV